MTSLTEHQQEGQEVFYVFALFGVIKTIKIPISLHCRPAASRLRHLNTHASPLLVRCLSFVSPNIYIYNRPPLHLVVVLRFEESEAEQILFNIYVLIKNVGYIQINFHRNFLLTGNIAARKLSAGYSG